jgi:hypothetical protein
MHRPLHCAEKRGKAVYQTEKTVFWLCNFIMQVRPFTKPLAITRDFSAALYAAFSLSFPRLILPFSRDSLGLIPTIHSPNNKSYMDTLDFYLEKLWKGACTV